jgi:desulfoferrodoxin (superoxide reductase-like protein)
MSPKNHLPAVVLGTGGNIDVSVVHNIMTMNHYIQFIWVKDVKSNKVVLARNFDPMDNILPKFKAKVLSGVTLQAFVFCNVNELWVGEEFEVP